MFIDLLQEIDLPSESIVCWQDLKTKNIFLENGRAIITDFGLVNVARRLCSRYKRPGDIVQVIEDADIDDDVDDDLDYG